MQIGIMQGRLSPARARLQSFPKDSWQIEFERARSYGFGLIEWLFDAVEYEENPIWTDAGLAQIRQCMMSSGVSVETICADYFVDHPLVPGPAGERRHHVEVLKVLITRASRLGARVILVPALEGGEVHNAEEQAVLLECLSGPLTLAKSAGVTLAVESNMPADHYLQFMGRGAHSALGVYFDTGNRSAEGFDIVCDIRRLGPYLRGVHIKDRCVDGRNVALGEGVVPFDGFFSALAVSGYSGCLVLETSVGDDYEYHARRNLAFVRSRVNWPSVR